MPLKKKAEIIFNPHSKKTSSGGLAADLSAGVGGVDIDGPHNLERRRQRRFSPVAVVPVMVVRAGRGPRPEVEADPEAGGGGGGGGDGPRGGPLVTEGAPGLQHHGRGPLLWGGSCWLGIPGHGVGCPQELTSL